MGREGGGSSQSNKGDRESVDSQQESFVMGSLAGSTDGDNHGGAFSRQDRTGSTWNRDVCPMEGCKKPLSRSRHGWRPPIRTIYASPASGRMFITLLPAGE